MGQPQHDLQTAISPPRARGEVRISAGLSAGRTRIGRLYQSGSAKALFPRTGASDLTAVLLNTAGGVTGGDRFAWTADAGAGADLTLATQTAERIYRALPGQTGRVTTTLTAGAGATLRWLPQETILFDKGALARRLDVDLAPDARFLGVESLVFGRQAMGEDVRAVALDDQWRIRQGGRLVYADALRLNGDARTILAGPATGGGARAIATVLLVAPDADTLLDPVRALLPATAGASLVRPGVLAVRVLEQDGFHLRRALIAVLETLGGPLPTVWKI